MFLFFLSGYFTEAFFHGNNHIDIMTKKHPATYHLWHHVKQIFIIFSDVSNYRYVFDSFFATGCQEWKSVAVQMGSDERLSSLEPI